MKQPAPMRIRNTFADRKEYVEPFDRRAKRRIGPFGRAEFVVRHAEIGEFAPNRFSSSKASNNIGVIKALGHFNLLEKAGSPVVPGVIENLSYAARATGTLRVADGKRLGLSARNQRLWVCPSRPEVRHCDVLRIAIRVRSTPNNRYLRELVGSRG